jgi:hypothetical protein
MAEMVGMWLASFVCFASRKPCFAPSPARFRDRRCWH